MKLFNSANSYRARTRSHNVCAACVKEARGINYMRLTRGVLDYRNSVGKGGGEHSVYRSSYRGYIKVDKASAKTVICVKHDSGVASVGCRSAKMLKASYVKVHRSSVSKVASARLTDLRLFKSAKHCAKQIVGRAYLANKLKRRAFKRYALGVYNDRICIDKADPCSDAFDYSQSIANVAYIGKIFYCKYTLRRDSSKKYWQGGVFHSAYRHSTV